jgi:hypothetical protein
MSRNPALDTVISAGTDFKRMRDVIVMEREAGARVEDLAESILHEAKIRWDAGDLNAVDAMLFHAVHAGIRPSFLFFACREERDREAGR